MAIGTSINVSLPSVGTTVHTLNQARVATYTKTLSVSSEDAPIVLTLRPAALGSNFKSLGATYKYDPSINDAGSDQQSGSLTVTINCNARIGAVLTRAEMLNHIRYALSAALKTDLLETLIDGGNT